MTIAAEYQHEHTVAVVTRVFGGVLIELMDGAPEGDTAVDHYRVMLALLGAMCLCGSAGMASAPDPALEKAIELARELPPLDVMWILSGGVTPVGGSREAT